jgi:hypothetical protein
LRGHQQTGIPPSGSGIHPSDTTHRSISMKSIILWLLGVPVSLIILLKLFGVF